MIQHTSSGSARSTRFSTGQRVRASLSVVTYGLLTFADALALILEDVVQPTLYNPLALPIAIDPFLPTNVHVQGLSLDSRDNLIRNDPPSSLC